MRRSRSIEPTNYKLDIGKSKNRAINPTKGYRTMRKMPWIMVSICAVSFAAGANAQTMDWRVFDETLVTSAHTSGSDWQKDDDAFSSKTAVSRGGHRHWLA